MEAEVEVQLIIISSPVGIPDSAIPSLSGMFMQMGDGIALPQQTESGKLEKIWVLGRMGEDGKKKRFIRMCLQRPEISAAAHSKVISRG